MKFLKRLAILSFVLIMLTQALFAENETTNSSVVEENDKAKYEALLLQMETRLEEHIVKGDEIVAQMIENNHSENITSQLEDLMDELKVILSNVQEGNNKSLSEDEAMELFEESKLEIIQISKEFKEVTSSAVDEAHRARIKAKIEERVEEHRKKTEARIEELKVRIEEKEIEFLIKKSQQLADKFNLSNVSELIEELKNKEITKEEFIAEFSVLAEDYVNPERIEAYTEKRQAEKKERLEKLNNSIVERRDEFITKRIDVRKEKIEEFKALSNEELVEKVRALDTNQKAKISRLIKQDVSALSDEELLELVTKFRPIINDYFSKLNDIAIEELDNVRGDLE